MAEVREIPIGKIKVGRHDQRIQTQDDELDGLAASISRLGLVYPCIVVPEGDEFLLVEGHRRLAAHKKLNKSTVNCRIEDSEGERAAEIAFAGNFFRKDLSPVELASAIADSYKSGVMTVEELAAGFHKRPHWVQRMIAICDWPADVLEAVHEKVLSVSAASNLACVTDDNYRSFLLRNAVEQGATARTTAAWLQAWRLYQPPEEAISAEPVAGVTPSVPLVPQAPCFVCSQVYAVNEMSHVPMCGGCIQTIRQVGASQG